jgi:hypothetical protein
MMGKIDLKLNDPPNYKSAVELFEEAATNYNYAEA